MSSSSHITLVSKSKIYNGWQERYQHQSSTCHCKMHFSIYLPSIAQAGNQLPVLYWLSGLTCTDQNFVQKSGVQRYAEEAGVIIVAPDTSPRGANLPGEQDSWDVGTGAGFYVTATQEPWSEFYNMYDYVVAELPAIVEEIFPVDPKRKSIFGHSMGGHGALVIALRNPTMYKSVSAFAPISAPMQCPWGRKAFSYYLGNDQRCWENYDASVLVGKTDRKIPMLIDQGSQDEFLTEQLKPDIFQAACETAKYPVKYRLQEGYDHSYFFINTFIADHIKHHLAAL